MYFSAFEFDIDIDIPVPSDIFRISSTLLEGTYDPVELKEFSHAFKQ